MVNFETAFEQIVGLEGAYSNDSSDPGGETKYGISKRAYPLLNIANLKIAEARAIYKQDYWDKAHCDALPTPLDLFVFDAAVNQGVGVAVRLLQKALGVTPDGVMGTDTLRAANNIACGNEIAALFMAERALRYVGTINFDKYGRGWLKRLFLVARQS